MYLWLSLLLLFSPVWADQSKCPKFCECIVSGVATCTTLDIEPFPNEEIHTLELKNLTGPISLTGEVLTKLRLPNLINLIITNAVVSRLDPSFFSTHRISQFVLRHSKIPTIDKALFRKSKYIQQIDLSYSTIERFDGIESSFVEEIILVGCGLTEIPPRALNSESLPEVSYLSLQDNKLSNVNISDLTGLQINLSGNNLTKVKVTSSEVVDLLVSLNLENNPLTTIEADDDVPVQALYVSKCKLRNLDFLKDFNQLTLLDMSHNLLSEIRPEIFKYADLMETLNLGYNNLTSIPADLTDLIALTSLTLDGNNLDTLPAFKYSGALNIFSCNNCKLKSLNENTFDHLRTTKMIYMNHNLLSSLPENIFSKVSSLIKLDLSNNSLTTLPAKIFVSNAELKNVNLSGNPLKKVSVSWFKENKVLMNLDISGCGLVSLWENNSDIKLTSLKVLKASNNSIKDVTVADLEVTPKLENFFLPNNPLDCNDRYDVLGNWLYTHNVITKLPKCGSTDFSDMQVDEDYDSDTDADNSLDDYDDADHSSDISEDIDTVPGNYDNADVDIDESKDDNDDDVPKTDQDRKKEFQEDADYVRAIEQGRFNERQRTSKEILLFVLPTLVFVLTALVVLLLTVSIILCFLQKRNGQRTNAPQITILPWSSGVKMKKHSGSIYRPLSEEKIPV